MLKNKLICKIWDKNIGFDSKMEMDTSTYLWEDYQEVSGKTPASAQILSAFNFNKHKFFEDYASIPQNLFKKRTIPKKLKAIVWTTYVGDSTGMTKCFCCQHTLIKQIEFHCGHVISVKNGGKDVVENMRPICAQCNLSMGSKNMNDFMKMYFPRSSK